MARGPGEATARAASDNRGRRSRVHVMGRRRGKRESEVRSNKKRWNRRMESNVGNRLLVTEKRFSGVRVQVLGGFELNDGNNLEKKLF